MVNFKVFLRTNNADIVRGAEQAAVDKALEMIGLQAEAYAKMLCPVDTGRLRNSITHEQENENTELLGTNVEYAAYVEMGHHTPSGGYVAPKPYIEPAVMNHIPEYKQIVMECLHNG